MNPKKRAAWIECNKKVQEKATCSTGRQQTRKRETGKVQRHGPVVSRDGNDRKKEGKKEAQVIILPTNFDIQKQWK